LKLLVCGDIIEKQSF